MFHPAQKLAEEEKIGQLNRIDDKHPKRIRSVRIPRLSLKLLEGEMAVGDARRDREHVNQLRERNVAEGGACDQRKHGKQQHPVFWREASVVNELDIETAEVSDDGAAEENAGGHFERPWVDSETLVEIHVRCDG